MAVDKRVKQSQDLIKNALWKLMQGDSFWELTVLQICQEAQVSRNTFYRLYDSKETLLRQCMGEMVKQIIEKFDALEDFSFLSPSRADIERTYTRFYSYWNQNKNFLKTLYRQELLMLFYREFCVFLKNKVSDEAIRYYEQKTGSAIGKYYYGWLASSLCSILESWAADGFRDTPRALTQITIQLYQSTNYKFEDTL